MSDVNQQSPIESMQITDLYVAFNTASYEVAEQTLATVIQDRLELICALSVVEHQIRFQTDFPSSQLPRVTANLLNAFYKSGVIFDQPLGLVGMRANDLGEQLGKSKEGLYKFRPRSLDRVG